MNVALTQVGLVSCLVRRYARADPSDSEIRARSVLEDEREAVKHFCGGGIGKDGEMIELPYRWALAYDTEARQRRILWRWLRPRRTAFYPA